MENTYYLAIDIGASSGRHILASMNNGKIELEEVYRFENGMTSKDGKKLWDTKRLFKEILQGMKECQKIGKVPYATGYRERWWRRIFWNGTYLTSFCST